MADEAKGRARSRLQRLGDRRRDRRERRAWRRERRKGTLNLYDTTNQAESSLFRGGFFKKD
jgi:hypothetical protein